MLLEAQLPPSQLEQEVSGVGTVRDARRSALDRLRIGFENAERGRPQVRLFQPRLKFMRIGAGDVDLEKRRADRVDPVCQRVP